MAIKKLTPEQVKRIVFTPNEAVKIALESIESRRTSAGVGVRFGVQDIDRYLLPGRPGELITVLGMSSCYKSGTMQYWARTIAQEIRRAELEKQCVVYASWEQALEEMVAFDLASATRMNATEIYQGQVSDEVIQRLRVESYRRVASPVWLIGHSIQEQSDRPMLSLTALTQALDYIREEFDYKPRAIFLDYLQQIEPEDGADRRMQVFDMVRRCKNLALARACPVIMAVQAGRGVYSREWGVPGMHEALETSNIEHTSDKIIGVWMPKQTHQIGKQIVSLRGGVQETITVSDNLLVMQVLKQKMGPSGLWWPLYVDVGTNRISAMEV